MSYLFTKSGWISACLCWTLGAASAQEFDSKTLGLPKSPYGTLVYGHEQFSADAFYQLGVWRYVYSIPTKTLFLLNEQNIVLKKVRLDLTGFATPKFVPYPEGVVLQSFDKQPTYALIKGGDILIAPKKASKKSLVSQVFPLSEEARIEAHQYQLSDKQRISKV
ncbi:MAG: hypothetical protein HC912_06585, partial [Saprospiraceae bacterium]|nr:hypothetical protein [Saprospiraceae bacterium]